MSCGVRQQSKEDAENSSLTGEIPLDCLKEDAGCSYSLQQGFGGFMRCARVQYAGENLEEINKNEEKMSPLGLKRNQHWSSFTLQYLQKFGRFNFCRSETLAEARVALNYLKCQTFKIITETCHIQIMYLGYRSLYYAVL